MNGQDLLEAMSFIDESYIHQMETVQKPRRKVLRWQPVAAMAACLALAMTGLWLYSPTKSMPDTAMPEMQVATVSETVAMNRMLQEPQVMAAMIVEDDLATGAAACLEMTVWLEPQADGTLLCTVVESGTASYEVGTSLHIILPEDAGDTAEGTYIVRFQPNEMSDTVQAQELLPMDVDNE